MVNQDFIIISDPKFLYNGSRKWPGSQDEARVALERSRTKTSYNFLLEAYLHSDFSEPLVEKVKEWTYSEFVCSALSCSFSNKEVSVYAWSLITQILMNSVLSDDVFLFLKKNNFFYNERIKNNIIEGVRFSFNYSLLAFGDERCIRNVLSFIEIDKKDIDKLIETFLTEKNFKTISNYLS